MFSVLDDLEPTEREHARHRLARIVDATGRPDVEYSYRFEAPTHETVIFDDRERAERYQEVYLTVGIFDEDQGTGAR
ncbi:hypothetical protein EGH21_19400 [Halomicroarcula sp. F13]|uniref:Halobacterial output domain-containing protein n=1 Tax=Haloarcula rubra TaxID=2487747 RepID=A0AAW4PV80_9EURY|nr:hypothetical protein [Halomicroarcula rubra]MBX0325195.1 hypothetical protein [Halomicroarcula rubra]